MQATRCMTGSVWMISSEKSVKLVVPKPPEGQLDRVVCRIFASKGLLKEEWEASIEECYGEEGLVQPVDNRERRKRRSRATARSDKVALFREAQGYARDRALAQGRGRYAQTAASVHLLR